MVLAKYVGKFDEILVELRTNGKGTYYVIVKGDGTFRYADYAMAKYNFNIYVMRFLDV